MPPSFSLIPSAFPSPTHTHSLTPSAAADVPKISSTPLPLPTLTPFSMSISSDFEHLPLAMVNQPIPTLLSTPPSSSLIPHTFVHLAMEHQSEPEPAPMLLPSIPTLPITPLHVHSTADNDTIFASTHPSSSPTSSTFLPSPTQLVIVNHLMPKLVSTTSTPPSLLLFSIPPTMSYTHSPAPSAIDSDWLGFG
ncbi:hypothetical protein EDB83DRAFT_2529185 [Lactarius deliciosus]|nr:hypothetical protein EDB83DRAFT_2529185 [Lactarius deliciosus]